MNETLLLESAQLELAVSRKEATQIRRATLKTLSAWPEAYRFKMVEP
jgi:hypothetical protein